MTNIDDNALSAQHARWLAARSRMGGYSQPTQIVIQRPKDIVQGPIRKLTAHVSAAHVKRQREKEQARQEKAERLRRQIEADKRALAEASRAANQEIRAIVLATANHFGLPSGELMSNRRVAAVCLPRQVAMYLAKELTPHSYPSIGRRFHRDHTTVLHGVRRVESLLSKGDPIVTIALAAIKDALSGGDPQNYWGA